MKTAITTTTIHVPFLIEDYIRDVLRHGREKDVNFVITGDRKTPPEAKSFCASLQDRYGIPVLFMDVDDQEAFMASRPVLNGFLPWNCLQRRNVAILKAWEQGADIIVLIDDDNFIACEDYVGRHLHLGRPTEMECFSTESGWYNICERLADRHGRKFYPRGYSWEERRHEVPSTHTRRTVRTVANGGFWLGDPDIDAVTRRAAPIDVIEYQGQDSFALGDHIYCPFNSQNTAIHRDIVPAYFLCSDVGRFDDIWASYVVERIAWHLGDTVSFGQPLVRQNRNEHDLWADAHAEEAGTKYTPDLCRWLREVELTSGNYRDSALELMTGLKKLVDTKGNSELPFAKRAFINHYIDGYRLWASSF